MAREKLPSVQDIARQVLRDVEAENHVKLAELQILRGVLSPRTKTELGHDLMKLASACAQQDEEPRVTAGDLLDFVDRCNRAR